MTGPWPAQGLGGEEPWPAQPGRVLAGRYRLGQALGRGGMAEVYDAVDLRLGRPVAVKLLRADLAADAGLRRRFEAEARSAARLSHPRAVAVYDTGEDANQPWIVMERLRGPTLADEIAAGPLQEARARRVGEEVLAALAGAHAAGLVHRDVKPANILLASDGGVKVGDFGIAKGMELGEGASGLTSSHVLIGTPAYLAPERIEGRPATARSDLWSAGVVLYEALAGTRPFSAATPLMVALAIRHGDVVPLGDRRPGIDAALAGAIHRALAYDPEDRFASAQEMAVALAAGAGATVKLGSSASPAPSKDVSAGLGGQGGRHRRRRRAALGGVSLWALALATGGLIVLAVLLGTGLGRGPASAPTKGRATTTQPATPSSITTMLAPTSLAPPPTSVTTLPPLSTMMSPPATGGPPGHTKGDGQGHGHRVAPGGAGGPHR